MSPCMYCADKIKRAVKIRGKGERVIRRTHVDVCVCVGGGECFIIIFILADRYMFVHVHLLV